MHVWTVSNQKGGVGKTTTAVALAGLLAEEGARVLLLDLDPHGSLSCYFQVNPDTQEASSFTLFEQRKQLDQATVTGLIQPSGHPGLSLLPASTALATLERQMLQQDGMGLVISKALALVWDDYDYAIIDTPPLLGVLLINALAACEHLVVPVQTEFLALKGLERMLHTLTMMQRSRGRALSYTVVPTLYDRRTHASVASLRALRTQYPEAHLWPGKIPVDTRLRDASKAGVPPSLFDPESRGVSAYRGLLKWLRGHQQPQVQAERQAL